MKRGLYQLFPIWSSRFKYQLIYLWPQAGYSLLKRSRDGERLAQGIARSRGSTDMCCLYHDGSSSHPGLLIALHSFQSASVVTLCVLPYSQKPSQEPSPALCRRVHRTRLLPMTCPVSRHIPRGGSSQERTLHHTVLPAPLQRE